MKGEVASEHRIGHYKNKTSICQRKYIEPLVLWMDICIYIGFCLPSMQKRDIVDTKWIYQYFVNDVKPIDYR